ncbi:hypothetical protein [Tsukamurella sp. NPDC003166]|uniref:hypothetical protein n=1 Tax=Tsukamurella sp. NPDC003166 TaxID=3154444 RepID=UPI0033A48858
MADQTVDQMLDAGAEPLQYFKLMLEIARRISTRRWPHWIRDVCRTYDHERGIDLAALRGDAVMLRAQATSAAQAITDQNGAKDSVTAAWPDNAGRAAVTTLGAQNTRSASAAAVIEATAKAAEAIPDAVVAAVATKIKALTEFSVSSIDADALTRGVLGREILPGGTNDLDRAVVAAFEQQLQADLTRFFAINDTAGTSIRAAYAAVPAAATGADSSAFPAPVFTAISATPTPTPGSPTTAAPVTGTGGGRGGGGAPSGSSPSTTSPTSASPTSTAPSTTGPTTGAPATAGPTATPTAATAAPSAGSPSGPTTSGAGTPSATTPSGATPSAGTPSAGDTGMPSWLSKLLPSLTEKLGLDKNDGATNDKTGGKGQDEDRSAKGAEEKGGAKVIGTDVLGRTVTATVSPDGKTVEITAKRPDGTEQKVTVKVGADGTLTLAEETPGADTSGTAQKSSATPTPNPTANPTTNVAAPPVAAPQTGGAPSNPNGAQSTGTGSGEGSGTGATASPTPSPVPAPANPKVTAQPDPAKPEPAPSGAAEEPCPPGEQQGSGAEFAVTVP